MGLEETIVGLAIGGSAIIMTFVSSQAFVDMLQFLRGQASLGLTDLAAAIRAQGVTNGVPAVAEGLANVVLRAQNYLDNQHPFHEGAFSAIVLLEHIKTQAVADWPGGNLPEPAMQFLKRSCHHCRDVTVVEIKLIIAPGGPPSCPHDRLIMRAAFLQLLEDLWPVDDRLPLDLRAQMLMAWHKN